MPILVPRKKEVYIMGRLRWGMTIKEWKEEICKDHRKNLVSEALETCESMVSCLKEFNVEEAIFLDFLDQAEIYGDAILVLWNFCNEDAETLYFFTLGRNKLYSDNCVIEYIIKSDKGFSLTCQTFLQKECLLQKYKS
jgi:hypothetical protein